MVIVDIKELFDKYIEVPWLYEVLKHVSLQTLITFVLDDSDMKMVEILVPVQAIDLEILIDEISYDLIKLLYVYEIEVNFKFLKWIGQTTVVFIISSDNLIAPIGECYE